MASAFERISEALATLGKRKHDASDLDVLPQQKARRTGVFKPWDQAEMHHRLETYRPLMWFAKPDACNSIACASRGWINVARDELCCDFCGKKLKFPASQNVSQETRARAASMFAETLSTSHEQACPWRHTRCDDSVLAYDPNLDTLKSAYSNRLAKLERVDALPELYPRFVHQLAHLAAHQPEAQPRGPCMIPVATSQQLDISRSRTGSLASTPAPKSGAGAELRTPAATGTVGRTPAGGETTGSTPSGAGRRTPETAIPAPGSAMQARGRLASLSDLLALSPPVALPPPVVIEEMPSSPRPATQEGRVGLDSGQGEGGRAVVGGVAGVLRSLSPSGFTLTSDCGKLIVPQRLTNAQKARMLALLGWDAEELPSGAAGGARMGPGGGQLVLYTPTAEHYSLAHLLGTTSGPSPETGATTVAPARWHARNVMLNCQHCKSRVGLWNYLPHQAPFALPPPEGTTLPAQGTSASTVSASGTTALVQRVTLGFTVAGGTYDAARRPGAGPGPFGGCAPPLPAFGSGGPFGKVHAPATAPSPVFGLHALAAHPPAFGTQSMSTAAGSSFGQGSGAAGCVAGSVKRKPEEAHKDKMQVDSGRTANSSSSAAAKRPRVEEGSSKAPHAKVSSVREEFDPLRHHRAWCPWVFTGSGSINGTVGSSAIGTAFEPPGTAPTSTPASGNLLAKPTTKCGWMYLVDGLQGQPCPAVAPTVPTTPMVCGLAAAVVPGNAEGRTPTPGDAVDSVMEEEGGAQKDVLRIKNSIMAALRNM